MEAIFYIVIGILTKHLLFDWLWQPREIAVNKGKNNIILLLHAIMHGFGMIILLLLINLFLLPISPLLLVILPLYDFIAHGLIDFVSARLVIHRKGLTPHDKMFWNTIGIDQYVHYISYLIIIILLT